MFGGLIWLSLRARLMGEIDRDIDGRAAGSKNIFAGNRPKPPVISLSDELDEFCQALPPSSYISLRGDRRICISLSRENAG